MTRPSAWLKILVLLLVLTGPGCSLRRSQERLADDRARALGPIEPTPSSVEPTPVLQAQSSPPPRTGELIIQVNDQNGGRPQAIPHQIEGPVSKTVFTGSNGEVKLTGPEGYYQMTVVDGCTDTVQVLSGSTARAGIAWHETS